MNALLLMIITFIGYIVAYHTYGKYLSKKIFKLNPNTPTPAHRFNDGSDYVPTPKSIVFGHHFTSIAGTGPIVGPAIGVIWGWLPAILWIFFGSIFMGAVHDFTSLVVSLRNDGKSIADITGLFISPRARHAFFIIILLALWIVIAIFGLVIAIIFAKFPSSVIPVWLEIPIAIALGMALNRRSTHLKRYALIAKIAMGATFLAGLLIPFHLPTLFGIPATGIWTIILLIYAFIASVLPVTTLLQPRDYLNAWQLLFVMGLLTICIVLTAFSTDLVIAAPAINQSLKNAPSMWPFLFVTIACGAVSGFHSLVSSGTTAKQVDNEQDAQMIGFGSMLLEGALATVVIIAVTAGLSLSYHTPDGLVLTGIDAWRSHYSSWAASAGLGSKLEAVVIGASNLMEVLWIPKGFGIVIMGVFIASFAGTTLDSATRIQRYLISEISQNTPLHFFSGKYTATFLAVVSAAILAFSSGANGAGALALWPLFGSVNQLLAALALMVGTVYLKKSSGLKWLITAIPCVFMTIMTLSAVISNHFSFLEKSQWLLLCINALIGALSIWIAIETVIAFYTSSKLVDCAPADSAPQLSDMKEPL